jgi:catechol 2,3-dioxygenase-like lactoylglutathione lyase family enzyme
VESPGFVGVLETVLYHDGGTREAVRHFYGDLLGLPLVAGWDDGLAFRVGAGVLLLFDRRRLAERSGPIAGHGASGPGHACLQAAAGEYERWRAQLTAGGIEIVHDLDWGRGRSFYFKDPAGNLLEIADCDFWPGR